MTGPVWWWQRIDELEHRADELGQVIPVYRATLERIAADPKDAQKLARAALVMCQRAGTAANNHKSGSRRQEGA